MARNMQNVLSGYLEKDIEPQCIIINASRATKFNADFFSGIETIKDGIITNQKSHHNKTFVFRRPSIFIFTNQPYNNEENFLSDGRVIQYNLSINGMIKNYWKK